MEPKTSDELLSQSIGDQESNGLALCAILYNLEQIRLQVGRLADQQAEMMAGVPVEQLALDLTTDIDSRPEVHPGMGEPVPIEEDDPEHGIDALEAEDAGRGADGGTDAEPDTA